MKLTLWNSSRRIRDGVAAMGTALALLGMASGGAFAAGERLVPGDAEQRDDHGERRERAAGDVVRGLGRFLGRERDQRGQHGAATEESFDR